MHSKTSGTQAMPEPCYFCQTKPEEPALVCSDCGRDIGIPQPLAAEHQALLQKRDRLRAELAEAKARLTARRRRPVSA
jgi:hypothetical protein